MRPVRNFRAKILHHRRLIVVDQTGFDTVGSGSFAQSWDRNRVTAYCTELNAAELKQALVDAKREKIPALKDHIMEKLPHYKTFPAYEELVGLNRSASPGNLV